jgi:hypothetical protein
MTGPHQAVTWDEVSRVVRWAAREAIRGAVQAVAFGLVLGASTGLARCPIVCAIVGALWGLMLGPAFGLARASLRLAEQGGSMRGRLVLRAGKAGGVVCLVLALPCGLFSLTHGGDYLPVALAILAAWAFGALFGGSTAMMALSEPFTKPAPDEDESGWRPIGGWPA